MLEIPEITFTRMLDEKLVFLKPLFIEKDWEVYIFRKALSFDGFEFRSGMIMEYSGSPIIAVYDDQMSFLAHFEASEWDIPLELRLALSLDISSIENAFPDTTR